LIKNIAKGKETCEEAYNKVALTADMATCAKGAATGFIKCTCDKELNVVESCPLFFNQGATQGDEIVSGAVSLGISLVLLCVCLYCFVKLLQSMVQGTSEVMLKKATSFNGYVAMLVGMGITILVQSSSVTTSVLTPLVGVGVLPLDKMYPLTLGANVGTTFTSFLASMVSSDADAVQIALCHLFFNLIGILIWYPVPIMRRVPLRLARGLGAFTRRYRACPLVYIVIAFVAMPGILLGISELFNQTSVGYHILGGILAIAVSVSLLAFLAFWNFFNGKKRMYNKLQIYQDSKDYRKKMPDIVKKLESELASLKKKMAHAPSDIENTGAKDEPAADTDSLLAK